MLIPLKRKYRVYKPVKRGAPTGGGHSGNGSLPARYLKKHERAQGLPGTPQGICTQVKGATDCRCGKHNRKAA